MTLDPIATRQAALERAARAVGPDPQPTPTTNGHAWNTWTPQDLRGIPAIGRGVTGAQPETEPGHGLDDWPNPDQEAA